MKASLTLSIWVKTNSLEHFEIFEWFLILGRFLIFFIKLMPFQRVICEGLGLVHTYWLLPTLKPPKLKFPTLCILSKKRSNKYRKNEGEKIKIVRTNEQMFTYRTVKLENAENIPIFDNVQWIMLQLITTNFDSLLLLIVWITYFETNLAY